MAVAQSAGMARDVRLGIARSGTRRLRISFKGRTLQSESEPAISVQHLSMTYRTTFEAPDAERLPASRWSWRQVVREVEALRM